MPLYKTLTPNPKTIIKIWKITESYEDLIQPITLKAESLQRVLNMKSNLHQRGFLSVRHLLQAFGYQDTDLFYDGNGKPYLTDGNQISITHSFNFSAVAVSNDLIGIDIEKQREKITVIAHKFVDYENAYLDEHNPDYIKTLTTIWCAKESLYKLYATPGISFLQHILVIPFTFEENSTVAWIHYKNHKLRYTVNFLEFEGFCCAYATP